MAEKGNLLELKALFPHGINQALLLESFHAADKNPPFLSPILHFLPRHTRDDVLRGLVVVCNMKM